MPPQQQTQKEGQTPKTTKDSTDVHLPSVETATSKAPRAPKAALPCNCLDSEQLRAIKTEYLQSLPPSEEMRDYSQQLRSLSPPKNHSPQTSLTSNIISWGSTIISGLSGVGTQLLNSAANLVDSVADWKKELAENPNDKEKVKELELRVTKRIQAYEEQSEKLLHSSPEEAKALRNHLVQVESALEELQTAIAIAKDGRCEMQEFADSCGNDEFANQVATVNAETNDAHTEIAGKADAVCENLQCALKNSNLTQDEVATLLHESVQCVETLQNEIRTSHATGAAKITEAAKATGSQHIIARTEQILRSTTKALHHALQKVEHSLDKCTFSFPDGWQKGLSVDHYLENPERMLASFINRYDLDVLEEIIATLKQNILSETNWFTLTSRLQSSEQHTQNTPRHFSQIAQFRLLASFLEREEHAREAVAEDNEQEELERSTRQ